MYHLEEGKRKMQNPNLHKNTFGSNSHNNLISNLEKKRADVSKEK